MTVSLFKENGQRYMLLISSNAYKDREDEIVTQKALEEHVANFNPEANHPVLIWHGGDPIGQVTEAKMYGPFLVEIVKELPDQPVNLARGKNTPPYPSTVKAVWDGLERMKEALALGASIGFKYKKGDELDGAFEDVKIIERSILPQEAAANAITLSAMIKGA